MAKFGSVTPDLLDEERHRRAGRAGRPAARDGEGAEDAVLSLSRSVHRQIDGLA